MIDHEHKFIFIHVSKTGETREIVAKKYAKDIEYFDYEFGE